MMGFELEAYDYSISHREGKAHVNANVLSRLPLPTPEYNPPRPPEVVHLLEHLNFLPVTSKDIHRWTDTVPVLAKVQHLPQRGWPERESVVGPELRPFFQCRYELSTEGGCVLWGCRVVVPPQGRKRAIQMLHEAHPGIVHMKALARGYVWWPGLDKQIEACVRECQACWLSRKEPPPTPLHT